MASRIALLLAAGLLSSVHALKPPTPRGDVADLAKGFGKALRNEASKFERSVKAVPAQIEEKARSTRIRAVARSKQQAPDRLDAATVEKMERQGFTWDVDAQTWRRGARPREEVPIFGQPTPEADPYDEDRIIDAMDEEFEDDLVIVKPDRLRRKFRARPVANSDPVIEEAPEELARLGFAVVDGRWTRAAPRTGARTVEINGGAKRTLSVKATSETDLKAVSRLEYILTYSSLQPPETVWDATLRVARDPGFVWVWAAAQARLWLLFAVPTTLDDFFAPAAATVDADALLQSFQGEPQLQTAAAIFFAGAYARKNAWAGSSGALTVGALERSIADAWFTKFERAPNSPGARAELGLPYALTASALTALAAAPRVAILHGYLQTKLAYDLFSSLPLDLQLEPALATVVAGAGAAVGAGAVSALAESATFTWARPPPQSSDETNAIADALKCDELAVRMLSTRVEKADPRRDGPAVVKCYKQAAQRAVDDGEAFERVADAWLMHFHGLSSAEVEVDDAAREAKTFPAVAAAFTSGCGAGAAFALGGLAPVLALHAAGAFVDALAPTPDQLARAKRAELDVDALLPPKDD